MGYLNMMKAETRMQHFQVAAVGALMSAALAR